MSETPDDHDDETYALLRRTHAGDEEALRALVARDLEWLRDLVHRRLGARLRQFGETADFVQDAALRALRYGPRFVVVDRARFRALLAKIVENVLCDAADHAQAQRRGGGRPHDQETVAVPLDAHAASLTSPSSHASRLEEQAWLEIALELLEAEDRRLIRMREWDRLEFDAIGARLGLAPDAARMRFNRALGRLARKVVALRSAGFQPDADCAPSGDVR